MCGHQSSLSRSARQKIRCRTSPMLKFRCGVITKPFTYIVSVPVTIGSLQTFLLSKRSSRQARDDISDRVAHPTKVLGGPLCDMSWSRDTFCFSTHRHAEHEKRNRIQSSSRWCRCRASSLVNTRGQNIHGLLYPVEFPNA